MDIKKELKSSSNLDTIIKNLHQEKRDINKKIYIFKILRFVEDIVALAKYKEFESSKVSNAILSLYYDREDDENYIMLKFTNDRGNPIDNSLDNKFRGECNFPGDVKLLYVNENFKTNKEYIFIFNESLKEKLLDLLLSSELKTILDYSQLDNDLTNTKKPIKKHKV